MRRACLLSFALAAFAFADSVTLRDRSVIEGKVTVNTDQEVVINTYNRAPGYGVIESFDCKPTGLPGNGEVKDPIDPDPNDPSSGVGPNSPNAAPPCFVSPPQLYGNQKFPRLDRGKAPLVPRPQGDESTQGGVKPQSDK